MFGGNDRVGTRYFDQDDRLLVTRIFRTLQGEGPFSGMPAVFFRLAKCNLACSFCDTDFDRGERLSDEEIERIFADETKNPLDHVLVVTGGEPLLQPHLGDWLASQVGRWRAVQIETNGTAFRELPRDVVVVVSPKCAEKDGRATRYLTPRAAMLERADALKFVVEEHGPYADVPRFALDWRARTGREVYVSPMNRYRERPTGVVSAFSGRLDSEKNARNHAHAASLALRHGLRFQVQAHLYAQVP